MPRLMTVAVLGISLSLAWEGASAQDSIFPQVTIVGSEATVLSVAAAGSLFEYRYSIFNATSSDAQIGSWRLNLSAPLGMHPSMLATNGRFIGDGQRVSSFTTAGHVPFGVDVPEAWMAAVDANGRLTWWAFASLDGDRAGVIAPGSQRDDWLVRSSHLPGIRAVELLPLYEFLCCPFPAGDPRNQDLDVRTDEDFKVSGATIGPLYPPEGMTFGLLAGLPGQAVGQGWLTSAQRTDLEQRIVEIDSLVTAGAGSVARDSLDRMVGLLGDEFSAGTIAPEAFWMLSVNADFLRQTIPDDEPRIETLLAGGDTYRR